MAQATLSSELLMEANREQASKPLRVCFVCTGNTCRSPMAQAVVNHLARTLKRDLIAFSAGLYAVEGDRISSNAVLALERAGIEPSPTCDYRMHTARSLGDGEAETFDLLVGMGRSHAMELMMRYPDQASKITTFEADIPDPFGGSPEVYRACLLQLSHCVKSLFFGGEAAL